MEDQGRVEDFWEVVVSGDVGAAGSGIESQLML